MDEKMHRNGNLISFDLVKEGVNLNQYEINQVQKETYSIRIECNSQVFNGVAYLHSKSSLKILEDGWPYSVDFTYNEGNSSSIQVYTTPYYFIFLPPSHNFDLEINANL
jgi:hypothetical protein